MPYALQVLKDRDHDGRWRRVVLEQRPEEADQFLPHAAGDCGYNTFGDALNAGTVALAQTEGQPYENEAADPVGNADCAAGGGTTRPAKIQADYVSRDDMRKVAKGETGSTRPNQTSNRYGTPLRKPGAKS